jgi:cytoskeletal protein RodZ
VTIGERLREARLRRELDIADAEAYTKIRAKYLRALENDEFAMLPDSTLAKTFLRSYSEYLGLDAQLLVEEYRAQHEPRGEGDVPAFAPRRAREARPRRAGPPIGPGGAFAIGIVLLLVLFAVLGLTGGDEADDGSDEPATTEQTSDDRDARETRERRERREARERRARAKRARVVLRVVPTGPTYVCVDDARGNVTFEGTVSGPRTFRGKRNGRLRINLGRAAVRLTANGKRVRIQDGPAGAGFSFSRTGRATPLPAEQRPCA